MFAALILAVAATAVTAVALTATADSATTTTLGQRVLRTGDSGADVKKLQKLLVAVGAKTATDGEFGRGTAAAVKRFQRWAGLQASGSVGARTVRSLSAAVKAKRTIGSSTAGGASMNMDGSDLSDEGDIPFAKATLHNGIATAPANAPSDVKEIIAAGNEIAKKPYVYGGGHGSWKSSGYDCSGSVSYALHGAGLLNTQLTSGDLEDWGKAGKGKWVTIYANGGHTFMYVAGLRFDTSGASPSRWQNEWRSKSGFVVRHPSGL